MGAEKKDLQHQLEEARSKAEAEAKESARVEDCGYHWGCGESAEFSEELLVTLVPQAFRIEGYFEAYVKFVKDHCQGRAEGQNPKFVEFSPPATVGGGLGDEEATPLETEASSPDQEGDVARTVEGGDHDEDPDI